MVDTRSKRGGARVGAGRPRAVDADALILDVCLDLLERHGYGGLSIDAVAAAAGVAKTTIYRRWPSKTALVAAAAAPLYKDAAEPADTGRLRSDLLAAVEDSRTLMTGRAGRILQIVLRESAEHAELREQIQSVLWLRRKRYHQVLARALARGELRPDVDLDLVCDLLLGPLWIRTLITPSAAPPELVSDIVDAVLEGVARRRSR
ncbi:MAG: TetR/AcrR family transcriptional regulator C-terminal ligand-binding domain-containing protein [Polyangia bacterium]